MAKSVLLLFGLASAKKWTPWKTALKQKAQSKADAQPNIIFVISDDLGWSDVSYNNLNLRTTPFLDELVKTDASLLKQSYATHRCTPSRASFLTGRYAFRFGLGSDPISLANPRGMSKDEKLLPEFLQSAGYNTHAIGKWHLGFCNSSFLPLNRGFDTHYGHFTGGMDYNSHAISGSYGTYLNHFQNGEPLRQENYTYATFDWGQRAIEVLTRKLDKPKFLYLAFNAPHEKVAAPKWLKQKMKTAHEHLGIEIPDTRLTQLAAVHAIDLAMKDIVDSVKDMERETIIVFHSDNGGALTAYGGKDKGPRACNYPYRGYKNTLFEGGTLSPTILYSTKREFVKKKFTHMVHITDWFPTFLHWAKYTGKFPNNLDGVDQTDSFEDLNAKKRRNSFVYGLLNTWDEEENKWTTQYVVRYGKWKFMNFRRPGALTYKCVEGFSNPAHEKYLFPTQPNRKNRMKMLNQTAKGEAVKPENHAERIPGFSLFNLQKDPFELQDLGAGKPTAKMTRFFMQLQNDIATYVAEELQKGFQYPITGKMRGKLFKRITYKAFKDNDERIDFFYETGRFKDFSRANMIGTVGNDWCPSKKDDEIFLWKYYNALKEDNAGLAYLLDMYLFDGYGPGGRRLGSRRHAPPKEGRFGSIDWDAGIPEDVWDDDDM